MPKLLVRIGRMGERIGFTRGRYSLATPPQTLLDTSIPAIPASTRIATSMLIVLVVVCLQK